MADIFISIGLDQDTGAYPDIDRLITSENLKAIAQHAIGRNHRLIVRDHPAVACLLRALVGDDDPRLVVIPEDTDADQIARTFNPALVFYMAGHDDVMRDFAAFTQQSSTLHIPLIGTGGAAQFIDGHIEPALRHPCDNASDLFGFERIARIIGALPAQAPRGPAPTL